MPGGFRSPNQLLADAVNGAPGRYSPPFVRNVANGVALNLIWARQGKSAIKIKVRNLGTTPLFYLVNGDTPVNPVDPLLPHDVNEMPVAKCSANNFHDVLGPGTVADDGTGAQVAFDDTEIKTLSVAVGAAGGRVGLIVVLAADAF